MTEVGRLPDVEPTALSTNAAYVGRFCYYLGRSRGRLVRLQVGGVIIVAGIASHYLPARSRYVISLKVSIGARTSVMCWRAILRQSVSDSVMRSTDKDSWNVDRRYGTKISLTQ